MKLSIVVTALFTAIKGGFAFSTGHAQIHLDGSEQFNIPTQNDGESEWRRLSNLDIIPLHSKARTGLIPAAVEEGLISACMYRLSSIEIFSV